MCWISGNGTRDGTEELGGSRGVLVSLIVMLPLLCRLVYECNVASHMSILYDHLMTDE
jgi:hypothetical protein